MAQKFIILSLLLIALAGSAVAQSQANTLVLVPVFFAGPGAFGSSWNTQLTVLNNSDKPLTSIPYVYSCGIPEGCLSAIPARASVAFTAGAPNCPACFTFSTGYFETVRSDELPQAIFTLRIFDQSKSTTDYGTEIPVVSQSAFTESELQFLDVPADSHFRTTLRAYSLPNQVPSVRIRTFQEPPPTSDGPQKPSVLMEESTATLVAPDVPSATLHGPSIIVNNPIEPQPTNDGSRYRVTVQSITSGVPIWALLTVTNNDTQHVAAVMPQTDTAEVPLSIGHWAGNGMCLNVSAAVTTVGYGCGLGTFATPVVESGGLFDADGTWTIIIGPSTTTQSAHLSGIIQGSSLTVTIHEGGAVIGPVVVLPGPQTPCGPSCV